MVRGTWVVVALVALLAGIGAHPALAGAPRQVHLRFSSAIPPRVQVRVIQLLKQAHVAEVRLLSEDPPLTAFAPGSLVIAAGDTALTRALLPATALSPAGPEGFVRAVREDGGVTLIAVDGNAPDTARASTNLGLLFGIYAVLEDMGFRFLHPLRPSIPQEVRTPRATAPRVESPRWPTRGIHLHTMHPLELTHLLNGWGPAGPEDAAGWEAMLPDWDTFLEWMLANRQNMVQWILLDDTSWEGFARSPTRLARLKRLVDRGRDLGLTMGVDVPLALAQQNGFRLIRKAGTLEEEQAELIANIDWLMGAGFQLLSTELGFSEFHSPDDRRMVAWLDTMTDHLAKNHQAEATVKIHVSVGEESKHYKDPDTGGKMNINFIPHFADPRLGVLVHTVQFYGLDDPAPTYGRDDFSETRRFLSLAAGSRPTYWYPETAYWVSFDIDVPLFLPVYAARRFHDLRLIAADEEAGRLGRGANQGARMQGPINFSSGWEWGYWLNDVLAARAAWDPRMDIADEQDAFRASLEHVLDVTGPAAAPLADLLTRTGETQRRLLIEGVQQDGAREVGQSYFQGVETWDDVADLLDRIPFVRSIRTQPDRLGLLDVKGRSGSRRYEATVRPLLSEMKTQFEALSTEMTSLVGSAAEPGRALVAEMSDAARMNALRARQMLGLYDRASRMKADDAAWKAERLKDAQGALDEATTIVTRREAAYRVDAERIAGWGKNPTSYNFGYLWTVRSLLFWWRDEAKVTLEPRSACFLNYQNPAEIATAEGVENDLYQRLETLVKYFGFAFGWADACLHPPADEPDVRRVARP